MDEIVLLHLYAYYGFFDKFYNLYKQLLNTNSFEDYTIYLECCLSKGCLDSLEFTEKLVSSDITIVNEETFGAINSRFIMSNMPEKVINFNEEYISFYPDKPNKKTISFFNLKNTQNYYFLNAAFGRINYYNLELIKEDFNCINSESPYYNEDVNNPFYNFSASVFECKFIHYSLNNKHFRLFDIYNENLVLKNTAYAIHDLNNKDSLTKLISVGYYLNILKYISLHKPIIKELGYKFYNGYELIVSTIDYYDLNKKFINYKIDEIVLLHLYAYYGFFDKFYNLYKQLLNTNSFEDYTIYLECCLSKGCLDSLEFTEKLVSSDITIVNEETFGAINSRFIMSNMPEKVINFNEEYISFYPDKPNKKTISFFNLKNIRNYYPFEYDFDFNRYDKKLSINDFKNFIQMEYKFIYYSLNNNHFRLFDIYNENLVLKNTAYAIHDLNNINSLNKLLSVGYCLELKCFNKKLCSKSMGFKYSEKYINLINYCHF
nr:putative immunity function [Saccharomycopsis crataegensis]